MTAAAIPETRPSPTPLHDPSRKIRPLGDRILVRRKPHVRQIGLIHLVGGRGEHMTVSEVVDIGPRVGRNWRASRTLFRAVEELFKTGHCLNAKEALRDAMALYEDAESDDRPIKAGDHVLHARVAGAKYDSILGRLSEEGDLVFLHEEELIAVVADPSLVVTGESSYDADGMLDFKRK